MRFAGGRRRGRELCPTYPDRLAGFAEEIARVDSREIARTFELLGPAASSLNFNSFKSSRIRCGSADFGGDCSKAFFASAQSKTFTKSKKLFRVADSGLRAGAGKAKGDQRRKPLPEGGLKRTGGGRKASVRNSGRA